MDVIIDSTENSAFCNNTTSASSECQSYTHNTLITVLNTVDWALTLPSVSWALWLLIREFRMTLETEFFMFNLLCLDMVCAIVNLLSFLNDLLLYIPILNASGQIMFYFYLYGHLMFQCCVCIERYLAVVHPVTFLMYRPVRYKVAALMMVWPVALAFSFAQFCIKTPYIVLANLLAVACIELFCSFSILRVLRNTGPGDQIKKERERSNLAKKRAFVIVVVLQIKQLVNYMPYVILTLMKDVFPVALYYCYLFPTAINICLFGNFIHSFHYLQRTGRLSFILCL